MPKPGVGVSSLPAPSPRGGGREGAARTRRRPRLPGGQRGAPGNGVHVLGLPCPQSGPGSSLGAGGTSGEAGRQTDGRARGQTEGVKA